MQEKMWLDIRSFLLREIGSVKIRPQSNRFKKWLYSLQRHDEGRILATSLAIDLLSGALNRTELANIFSAIDGSPRRAIESFAEVLDKEPYFSRLICCSPFPEPPDDSQEHLYVRIVEMASFITFYLGPTYGYTNALDDRKEIADIFLNDRFRFEDLDDLDRAWTGSRGRVWVLPRASFETILNDHKANAASVLNDALGLGYPAGPSGHPEFLAVFYPSHFPEKCKQPTSADARWSKPGFYLSNGREDAWGRTQSCSGRHEPIKERVHAGVDKFSGAGFSVKWVGPAAAPPIDRKALLKEAFCRYKKFRSLRCA